MDEPVADKAKEMESHEEKESQNISAEIVPEEKKESEEKQSEDTSELQNMETEPVSDFINLFICRATRYIVSASTL